MKPISYIVVFVTFAVQCSAQLFYGDVRNSLGSRIEFTNLRVTHLETGQRYDLRADGSGEFGIWLFAGTWLVDVDADQIAGWGYSPYAGLEIIMDDSNVRKFIILETRTPIEDPKLFVELDVLNGRISYTMQAQGGTRMELFASDDLVNWNRIYSTNSSKGAGIVYSTFYDYNRYPSRFFRLQSVIE